MSRDRPSGLLHPVAIAAIAVLIVNDHVLKAAYPGWITGKLSDFAGLAFFPLLVRAIAMRWTRRDPLAAITIATGVGFAAAKLWQPANALCEWVLGALQWPVHALVAGEAIAIAPVSIVRDPTDLIALPALAVAWWIGVGTRRVA